jgi:hypothetical protein
MLLSQQAMFEYLRHSQRNTTTRHAVTRSALVLLRHTAIHTAIVPELTISNLHCSVHQLQHQLQRAITAVTVTHLQNCSAHTACSSEDPELVLLVT